MNDIVNEVEKQLESLKRQAAKARRWRAVKEEMQGRERVLFGRRFLDLMERSRTLEERHATEAERERAASIALETEEAQLEVLRQSLYEHEAALEAARTRLQRADARRRPPPGPQRLLQAADGRDRRARAGNRARGAGARRARRTARRDARRAARTSRAACATSCTAAEAELGAAEAAVAAAAAALAAAETDQERGREAQVALLGRIATLQNSKAAVSGNAERAEADLKKLAAETGELEREREHATAVREAARAKGREAETRAAELTGARDAASARADAARARAEVLARDVETLQSERDGLAGRLASLEEMVATHSAFDEGVRALLARPEGVEVIGVVADALETGSEHERAVEAFLGDRLQAVLVPDAGQALRGIRWLQSQSAGRGAFLPLASARTRGDCGPLREIAAEEPKALGLLSDFYRVSGPHAERIRASLPDAIVVATLEDALDLATRQGPVAVVTLEGETLRGAMVEGGRGVKGLLAPRREIKEVAARQEQLEARLLAMRSEAAEALAVVTSAAAEARALDEQIHATEKELVAARHEIQAADDEAARLHRKGVVLDAERAQAEQERKAAAAAAGRDGAGARRGRDRARRGPPAAGRARRGRGLPAGRPPRRPRRATPRPGVPSPRCASARPPPRTTAGGSRATCWSSSSASPPPARAPPRRRRGAAS